MKFKIHWCEYHDPLNWAENADLEKRRERLISIPYEKRPENFLEQLEKLMEKIRQDGIKELHKLLPAKDIHPDDTDGWVECECEDTFEAKDIEEAKVKAINDYDINTQVFRVSDEKGKELFTEEDC